MLTTRAACSIAFIGLFLLVTSNTANAVNSECRLFVNNKSSKDVYLQKLWTEKLTKKNQYNDGRRNTTGNFPPH